MKWPSFQRVEVVMVFQLGQRSTRSFSKLEASSSFATFVWENCVLFISVTFTLRGCLLLLR